MKFIAFSLLFLLIVSGCKKDDPQPTPSPKPPVTFKFGYRAGSYVCIPSGTIIHYMDNDSFTTIKTSWKPFFVVHTNWPIQYECTYTKKITGYTWNDIDTIYPQ